MGIEKVAKRHVTVVGDAPLGRGPHQCRPSVARETRLLPGLRSEEKAAFLAQGQGGLGGLSGWGAGRCHGGRQPKASRIGAGLWLLGTWVEPQVAVPWEGVHPRRGGAAGSGRGFLVPRAPRVTVLPAPAPSSAGGFEVLTLVWGQSSRVRGRGGRSGTEEPAAGAEASAGGGTGPGAPGRGHRDVGPSGEVARLSPALTRAWAQRTGSRGAPTPVGAGAAAQPPPRAHRPHTRPHGCPSAVKGRNL